MLQYLRHSCGTNVGSGSFLLSSPSSIPFVKLSIVMMLFGLFLVSLPHTSHFSSLPSGVVSAFPMTEGSSDSKLKFSHIKNVDSVSSSSLSPLPPAELHFSLVDKLSSSSGLWKMRVMPWTTAHDYSDHVTGSHESNRHGMSGSDKMLGGHAEKGSPNTPEWREARVVDVVREEGESQYRTVSLLLPTETDDFVGSTSAKKNNKKKISRYHAAHRRTDEENRDDSSHNGDGRTKVVEGRETKMDVLLDSTVFERMICEEYNVLVPRTTTSPLSISEDSNYNGEEVEEDPIRPSRRSNMYDASDHRRRTTRARHGSSDLHANRFGRCYFTVASFDEKETDRNGEELPERGDGLSSAHSQNVKTDVEPFFTYRVRVPSAPGPQKRRGKKKGGEKRLQRGAEEDRTERHWGDDVADDDDDDDDVPHRVGQKPYDNMEEDADSLQTGTSSTCDGTTSSYFRCSITSLNQYISIDQLSDTSLANGAITDDDYNGDEKSGENNRHDEKRLQKEEDNDVTSSSFSATASRGSIAMPLYAFTILEPRVASRGRGKKMGEKKHARPPSSSSGVKFRFDGEEGKEYSGFTSYFRMVFRISALSPSSYLPSKEQESKVDFGSSSSVSSPTGDGLTVTEKQTLKKQKEILNVVRLHDVELQLYNERELFAGAKHKAQQLERTRKGISSVFRRWVYPLGLLLLFYSTLVAMKRAVQWWNHRCTLGKTKSLASKQRGKGGAPTQRAAPQRWPSMEGKGKKD